MRGYLSHIYVDCRIFIIYCPYGFLYDQQYKFSKYSESLDGAQDPKLGFPIDFGGTLIILGGCTEDGSKDRRSVCMENRIFS